mgnify:CR=1 FL=1
MATFEEAYLDLTRVIAKAKDETGLAEETLIDLFKTQLVYGQAPITSAVDVPSGEYVGGEATEFTEEQDDDEGSADDGSLAN